jgi:hypothetical protein
VGKSKPLLTKLLKYEAEQIMRIAIHQPNYLPYIGFFQKMALADVFVMLDTVQFSKDSYTQRTKIKTKDSWMWLTIPIEKKYHFNKIRDISLPNENKWLQKHRLSIISNYSKCKYFDTKFIDDYFNSIYKFEKLQEFNEFGIFYLKEKLEIKTKIVRASELNINPNLRSTDLLIDIINKLEGDTYISGCGAKKYLNKSEFIRNNIALKFFKFKPFEYSQRWSGFEPFCTALDLFFNIDCQDGVPLQKISVKDIIK